MDEALCLPSKEAAQIALRTQQLIAHETGVADTVDPMAGSYYIESLTNDISQRVECYIQKIDEMGGAPAAIENGFIQKEIQASAYRYQREIESEDRIVVGLNRFQAEGKKPTNLLRVNPAVRVSQKDRIERLKSERDAQKVNDTLVALKRAALGTENLMSSILDAVKAFATLGEICDVLRDVFGEYQQVSTLGLSK